MHPIQGRRTRRPIDTALVRIGPTTRRDDGTPVGTPEFGARQLEKKVSEHEELLNKIPDIKDLQCAWLVLLYCATATANYFLRTVGPERSRFRDPA